MPDMTSEPTEPARAAPAAATGVAARELGEFDRINAAWVIDKAVQVIVFIGWIIIPRVITILGFASTIIGTILLVISLFKIAIKGVEFFGDPDKWIPEHKEKAEKKRKMDHYYYHCERNPEGFMRLKFENFDGEDE